MARKKSYNPFNMGGSYVGLLILAGFGFFLCLNLLNLNSSCSVNSYSYLRALIGGVIGFIIGWGIHSFFRNINK